MSTNHARPGNAHSLPTWDDIVTNAITALTTARNELSEARDWLLSDHHPLNRRTAGDAAAARRAVLAAIGELKSEIDQAKNQLTTTRSDA